MSNALVSITDLAVIFDTRHGEVRAVDGVSLRIAPGERVSLLGESGCGKTVLALTLLGLLPRNARVSGSVIIDGIELAITSRRACGNIVSLCWSNAERFFDPVMRVGAQIVEAYTVHHPGQQRIGREKALSLLESLGFQEPVSVFRAYPCQLSGGMNQRAMIAMSMINGPRVLVVDEPTRGLDDQSRERVISSIANLEGVTLLLITHDVDCALRLTSASYIMRKGVFIDRIATANGLTGISNPYTERLVRSCPNLWEGNDPGTVMGESIARRA